MGVGVHQHIRTGVACCPLHCLDVTAGDHQLIGRAGVPQTVKDDARELRVCVLPFEELLPDEHRLHSQTVREPQEHPTVAIAFRVKGFFPFQPFQPLLQFLSQGGDIKLRYSSGIGPFNRADVTSGLDWIDKRKVMMSYLTYDHAGRPDKNGQRRIFSMMDILPPETVCTETYIVIDCFDTEQEAKNLMGYLKTRFVRFLVAQLAATQHLSKATFGFVPVQNFTEKWTDEKLYKKYELAEDEIAFIESTIRVMD